MKDSFNCYLDLTHINEELEDVECEAHLDIYKGSNTSDDPSEISIESIQCVDNKCQALFGHYLEVTEKLESTIIKNYNRQ